MSESIASAEADAPAPTPFAMTTPFAMIDGDVAAMRCEGDVCYVPAAGE